MKLFSIILIAFSCSIHTFSRSDDTIRLDDVHVFSSLTDVRQKQTLRSLSIISSEQINRSNLISLDEIMRYIPGLETHSRNLFGVQTDYSIRGSTFNQVLVLIDGVRLNDPLTGHFSSYIPVPLSGISRIEVIRGPAAIMYGPDAVGGVINIVTNTYANKADSIRNVSIRAGAGQYELINTDAGFSRSSEKVNYSAGFKILSSGGYPATDGFRDDFRIRTATASVSLFPTEQLRISYRTAIDGREFSARRFYTISMADTARENVNSWWNHLNGVYYGTKSITSFDAGIKTANDEYIFNPQTISNQHRTNQIIVQVKNQRELIPELLISTGIQTYYKSIRSNDRGDHDVLSGGLYAMSYFSPIKSLNISVGLRWEYVQKSGSDILPQINASYNKGVFTLRGLAGKTIRTADFTERYVSTNIQALASGRNLGNPDLLPEKSWSFEAGSEIKPNDHFTFDFTAFKRIGTDLIDYVLTRGANIVSKYPVIPDGNYFYANNISRLNTRGMEFVLTTWHSTGLKGNIYTSAGYTIQKSESPSEEVSKYISNQSRQLFILNTTYSTPRFGLYINGIYKQRNPEFAEAINSAISSSYWLFNMRTDYGIIPQRLSIEFRIDNILNAKYSDVLGAELPGRWLSGGIRYWMKY